MHDPCCPAVPGNHLALRSPTMTKLLFWSSWWLMMRRAIVSWTNSSGRLGSLVLLSACTVALCRPPESSSHGFAEHSMLCWPVCAQHLKLGADVSIVTAIASRRPVQALNSTKDPRRPLEFVQDTIARRIINHQEDQNNNFVIVGDLNARIGGCP